MLGPIEGYLQDPGRSERTYAAQRDKSWTGNGVDPDVVIKAIADDDPRVALQLKVLRAFGMRVKEAVMFKPHRSDMGQHVALPRNAGTKGGRPRSFPVDTPEKRAILDEAKSVVPTLDGHISNPNKTLKQNIDRFYNVIRKHGISKASLGVTAHGLRAGYLIDRFKEITGEDAPVRGGTITADKKESVRRAQYICAEESGHSRYSISTAYYGPIKFIPLLKKDSIQRSEHQPSCGK
jgi:integrase